MNTAIILTVASVLILTVLLRLASQPRIRHIDPGTRYRLFTVLLFFGIGSQAIGAIAAAFSGKAGSAGLFVLMGFLIALACALEMRKLRKEFS